MLSFKKNIHQPLLIGFVRPYCLKKYYVKKNQKFKILKKFTNFDASNPNHMRSRFFLLFIVFLPSLFSGNSYAQITSSINPDARLYQCFDSSYIHQMQQNNPSLLAYYNFYLDNSYYTTSLTQSKPVTGEDIKTVKVNEDISKKQVIYFSETKYDAKTFNVLKYSFKTQDKNFTTYLWKDANIAIVFLPRDKIAAAFKQYCTKNNIKNN